MNWLSYEDIKPEVICYGNGIWICAKHVIEIDADMIWYSTGESYHPSGWTSCYKTTSLTNNFIPTKSCYGNSGFVIAGIADNLICNSYIFYSPDGINWSGNTITNGVTNGIESICYGNNKYLCVDNTDNSNGALSRIFYSTDLLNWTNVFSETIGDKVSRFEDCDTGNGKFVVVGNNCIYSSTDVANWTHVSAVTYNPLINYGNSRFIISSKNKILYSYDALNWYTGITSDLNDNAITLNFAIDRFVANTWDGMSNFNIKYSINGLDWILNISPLNPILTEIDDSISAASIYGGTYYTNIIYDLPDVIITDIIDIVHTGATVVGNVISEGTSDVISRGICWNNTDEPSVFDNKITSESGSGIFATRLTGLTQETTFCVRTFAINSSGTSYAHEQHFTTLGFPSVGIDANPYDITKTEAKIHGTLYTSGGTPTTKGVCWNTHGDDPTLDDEHTVDTSGIGEFVALLTGLTSGTTYYVNVYGSNLIKTVYSQTDIFSTLSETPIITLNSIINIANIEATTDGVVNSDGGSPIINKGVCWSTLENPTISDSYTEDGSGVGSFSSIITGLNSNTIYYVRGYATNMNQTFYSLQRSFKTLLPYYSSIIISPITDITTIGATSGGEVISDGGSAVTERGICWSTSENPTILNDHTNNGSGIGTFISNITGLISGVYYVRAYATNSVGTSYSEQKTFATSDIIFVTTNITTNITENRATSGGEVLTDGGHFVTERGICWSTSENPTISDSHINGGSDIGSFIITISNLLSGTTYYIRSYAINSIKTVYGNQQVCITISSEHYIGQSFGGGKVFYIDNDNQYGLISSIDDQEIKSKWGCEGTSIITYSSIGSGLANTISIISGCNSTDIAAKICYDLTLSGYSDWFLPSIDELDEMYLNKDYIGNFKLAFNDYYWSSTQTDNPWGAYAKSFARGYILPGGKNFDHFVRAIRQYSGFTNVTTDSISALTENELTCGGNVVYDGGDIIIYKGICWSTTENPTILNNHTHDGTGTGYFVSYLSGLTSGTTYYIRAYCTNKINTYYGSQQIVTTLSTSTHYIGESYCGGIIFYLNDENTHGLVSSTIDQGPLNWGCYNVLVGTYDDIGSGKTNTLAIVRSSGDLLNAAVTCHNLILNGYREWFLPSFDELNLMYLQKDIIGNFDTTLYWSSTENYKVGSQWANTIDFGNGNKSVCSKHYNKLYLFRPIRSF